MKRFKAAYGLLGMLLVVAGGFVVFSNHALAIDEESCKQLNQGTCAESTPSGGGWLQQFGKCIVSADPNTTYHCYTKPVSVSQCSSRGGKCLPEGQCGNQPGASYIGYCENNTSNVCCMDGGAGSGDLQCTGAGARCSDTGGCKSSETASGQCANGDVCCKPNGGDGAGSGDSQCTGVGSRCSDTGGCKGTETPSGQCTNGDVCCKPKTAGPGPGPGTGSSQTVAFGNPLQFDSVEDLLLNVMTTLQKIIVTLALVFIVIGAIMYILSAGNDTQMKAAKGTISAALIGMAIGLAAPSFLKEIYIILSPTGTMSPELASASTLSEIALRVLNFLLSVVGILAMIMLLIGSLMYLTAAGDEKRAEEGKKIFKYSVTGIAIAFAALVIVKQIASFFG
jgi:hypothetical protein